METIKAIAKRKSVRAYKPDQIPEKVLNNILAAGCAAPVGMANYNSLHITVVQDKEVRGQLSDAIRKIRNGATDAFYEAPTVIILSSTPQPAPGLDYVNAACISENLMLAAADAGVGSVIIWATGMVVEANDGLKQAIGLPEGFKALFGIALGYAKADDTAEKDLKLTIGVNRV